MAEDARQQAVLQARRARQLLALDPLALGGARVLTDRGPACDAWLDGLRRCLDAGCQARRLPPRINDEALLGGTDLTASLRLGRPVQRAGLLHAAAGGLLIAGLAERIEARTAALIAATMDGAAPGERTGGLGLVALDSGAAGDEACPAALAERLALHVDLRCVGGDELALGAADPCVIGQARRGLAGVRVATEAMSVLCATAHAFGIGSARAVWLALVAARANAALEQRRQIEAEDLEWAARLVLAPRARALPAPPAAQPPQASAPGEPQPQDPPSHGAPPPGSEAGAEAGAGDAERVVAATQAAIPAGLLADLTAAQARRAAAGQAGGTVLSARRGRPIGVRAGAPRGGARLDLLATLRTAAPWQCARRAQHPPAVRGRVLIETADLRIRRFRERTQSLTLFVLDASGSNALHRMAECKGAVELWLSECYVRRDQVAVVSFRGQGAEVVVPPTRSLVRARRSLAGLAGGGGTPLAHGLDVAGRLALQLRRRGLMPQLVLLTDGQANVALDGTIGRMRAGQDALSIARQLGAEGLRSLLVDCAPRPQPVARSLAAALRGRYAPLPHADAHALLAAVRRAA